MSDRSMRRIPKDRTAGPAAVDAASSIGAGWQRAWVARRSGGGCPRRA